ncbi:MAG: protein-disulfide reductase DsbD N-terminal domain-containing protein [Stenotrophobium sp.]
MRSFKSLLLVLLCALPFAASADVWLKTQTPAAPQILDVGEAFELMPVERSGRHLTVSWFISKGYYLYRERMHFKVIDPQGERLGMPKFPASETHHDAHFGDVHIYRGGRISVELPLAKSASPPRQLEVSYQGCAESGVCYPPQTKILDIPAQP